ncbi:AraC family transcriptional regulator [Microlunatus sp. Gsoil 973]|uniref:helix-turn-helix domain-containing protein n=1 Tax=Microlunatus sp. Gsoil 973 TaxID=2672569 RepID=UPI0012B4CB4E|nr:AraC family transcriptional regulator [Microlunatus sp. Gsoil 973]QGN34794.1 helix-turn-helix domain-containing protein [Microlunatus sp. Gsoil 973]
MANRDAHDQEYWSADGLMPQVAASVVGYTARSPRPTLHRGAPSPHVTLVITLDQPVVTGWSVEEAFGTAPTRVDIATAGLHLTPAYIRQPQEQSGIQIALHLPAARSILGLRASELCSGTYEGVDVVGREIGRLRARLIDTTDWPTRFGLVRQFLQDRTDRADDGPRMRTELAEAWAWLGRHRGAGRIAGLAGHVMLSERQLHSLFTAEFGIGPKRFNRLLRFQRAKRLIGYGVDHGRVDLAGIAADCGYADQSHLTRDFRSFVGIGPTRWVDEEYGGMVPGGMVPEESAETFYRRTTADEHP